MKRYEELSEELKDKARVWEARNYEKWTYMVRDNEMKNTVEYFINKLENNQNRLINMCEQILLRPNDNKLWFGEEGFNNLKIAVETILEKYKDTDIYKYYYEFQKIKHGFCGFERWKRGLLW